MHKLVKSEGFTLIELMVTIAIVGVLTAVAQTRYEAYAAKARQVEAKTTLSDFYTVQQTFFADNLSYTVCLTKGLGYKSGRPLDTAEFRYSFGFVGDGTVVECGPYPMGSKANCNLWRYPTDSAQTANPNWQCPLGIYNHFYGNSTVSSTGGMNGNGRFELADIAQIQGVHGPDFEVRNSEEFKAFAGAYIKGDAATGSIVDADLWQMDQTGKLVNLQSGI